MEHTQTIKIENLETLDFYFKDKVKSKFWDIVIGTVSQKHLLKRRFSEAIEMKNDNLSIIKLEKLMLMMSKKGIEKKNQHKRNLVLDALTYLFLKHLLNSDFTKSKDVLSALLMQIGDTDKEGIAIFKSRIQYIFESSINQDNQKIKAFSELSKIILQFQPSVSFAIVNVALDLLINEFNYYDAYKELNKIISEKEKLTIQLIQVTKFLLDINFSGQTYDSLIELLVKAKHHLFEKKSLTVNDFFEERNTIDTTIKESIFTKIPGIQISADIIKQLFDLVEGKNSCNPELIISITENKAIPDWLKWTALRFILFNKSSVQDLDNDFINIDNFYLLTPRLLKLLCYEEPSFLIKRRDDILKLKYYQKSKFIFNLFGWNNDLTERNIDINLSIREKQNQIDSYLAKELTTSVKEISKIDIEICYELFNARKKIYDGDFEEAIISLSQLLQKIINSSVIIKMWWEPIILYWLSLANAHNGNLKEAIEGLQTLNKGIKAEEANVQIALCLIKNNDIKKAEEIISLIKSSHPGTLYVKALLAWRLNEIELSVEHITKYLSIFGETYKHYYNACIRLLALIKEVQGDTDIALEMLIPVNSNETCIDRRTAIRVSRLIVRQAYQDYLSLGSWSININTASEILTSMNALIPDTARENNLKLFFDILKGPKENSAQLQNVQMKIPRNYAWHHLLLFETTKSGDFSNALNMINNSTSNVTNIKILPAYYVNAIFSIISWHLLTCIWRNPQDKQYDELNKLFIRIFCHKDEFLFRFNSNTLKEDIIKRLSETLVTKYGDCLNEIGYIYTINCATKIAQNILLIDSRRENTSIVNMPQQLTLVKSILSLLNTNNKSEIENISNEIIVFINKYKSKYQQNQIDIAHLFAYWYQKDLKGFMGIAESTIYQEYLPIVNDHLWLAKAFVWFKNEQYNRIFESEMPDSIGDLSNQDACILMAKASSRLALKAWKTNNTKEAINHVKQAASTLKSLNQFDTVSSII